MKEKKRQLSALAVLALLVLLTGSLYIYSEKPDDRVYVTNIEFDDLKVDDSVQDHSSEGGDQAAYTCSTVDEAGQMLREGMKDRKTTVVINFTGTVSDANAMSLKIHNIALEHTGEGDEGDYLNWNHTKISRKYNSGTKKFTYVITYLDDAGKEKATTAAIKKLEAKLSISSGDSTYKKVRTIYDYLANHITYDYKDTSNLPYTAYDAIVNGKAVCQGYATLFYRILLDYGIDNRIIVSTTHAWNLVNVDGQYYECDLTWDSQNAQAGQNYEYFLKASLTGSEHKWRTSVLSASVSKLPRASANYATDTEDSENNKKVQSAAALAAPTLNASGSGKTATLNWSAVSNAQGYRVYRKTGSGSWKKIATVTETSYSDKGLKKGSYSYRILPYSKSAKGSYSSTKKVTIK